MSITKTLDGQYQVRVNYRDGVKYRQKTRTFKRKGEAASWESRMRVDLDNGADLSKRNVTFADYFKNWISVYKTDSVSKHTNDMYLLSLKHLINYFGATKLADVRKDDYQKFMNEFGKNHGIATSRKTNQQIRSAVQNALADNVINRDFTFRVVITGDDPAPVEAKFLDLDDYHVLRRYLIDHADFEHMSSCMLLFQLETGCRFEEAAGMTWDNLDLDNGIVNICRQWSPKTQSFTKTKGNGQADGKVTIPTPFCDFMHSLHQQAVDYFDDRPASYEEANPRQLVFFSKFNSILTNDGVNQALQRMCHKLKIKEVTSHAMRHTHASVLIQNGSVLPYVQHRLRHRKLETTINTYVHLIEKTNGTSDQLAMKLMSEGFEK
jgi:integrase